MDKLPVCYGQGIAPYCPACGSGEYLHNEDGNRNDFCGRCGCPLDWSRMYNEDTEQVEEKFKCGDCAEYCRSTDKETQGVCKAKGVHVRRSKPACKKHFRKSVHIWGMNINVKQGIDNCYMVHRYEHPGYENDLCAGLRTMNGDGEPCETCQKCHLYYGHSMYHEED